MAEIVSIIGITHNPFMPRLFKQPQQPPGTAKIKERIAMMRQKLADAKPDVLICIGNDHLHQFFMDNMPAFMIGKMDQYDGTFYDEEREFGLPKCKLPGDVNVSDAIMEGAFDRGAIDSLPTNKRIGVLVSGHLSLEVGGPKQFERHLTDPDFDAAAVGWIVNGDIDGAANGCTPEKMIAAGNMTSGYLNFLMMMGVANSTKPSHAEGLDAGFPAIPFFSWDKQP